MNQIYRLVWSHVNQAWVAVAENAKGHGKSISGRKLVAATAALIGGSLLISSAYAADAGNATVVGGNGSVAQNGTTTTINQTSQRLAIDWTGLSTAANEALVFKQPNASAIALNRITGSSPSSLLGSLSANGQVYILNPNGVLFGAGAQVNVGGLVASTLTMNANDFMNGGSTFTKDPNSTGNVVNQGSLTAADGGYIALLSGTVRNEGTIDAPLGTALLAAGDKVTLNVNNGSLIGYSIDQGDLNALVENKQLIRADGGQVLMVAKALDALSTAVINNTGVVEARTVQNKNGHILLLGDMDVGTVNVGGTLDVSAPTTGDGGSVETSAAHVKVADGTVVTGVAVQGLTGSWLVDPFDFTVAASGGDMTGATLSATLGTIGFTVRSTNGGTSGSGDININDVVSWNAATTLTLNAQRNININQSITSSNASGQVSLLYGQSTGNGGTATYNIKAPINLQAGQNFSTKLGSSGPLIQYTVITSLGNAGSGTGTDLQGMNGNLGGNYVLGSDIDATATSGWNSNAGFTPIAYGGSFTGIFDGLGHVISNLTINLPANDFAASDYVGLFSTNNGTIRNVGLVGNTTTGGSVVGGLVGKNYGTVDNSFTTGVLTSVDSPLLGPRDPSPYIGGLVGINYGTVSNSYVTGAVNGSLYSQYVGGLVGENYGTISNSYAAGAVNGRQYIGGLVGRNVNYGPTLGQSTAGMIRNSYATGNLGGTYASYGGGLVGQNYGGSVIDSYAAGHVATLGSSGGLIGISSRGFPGVSSINGTISGSFWNTQTSGISNGIGSGSTFLGSVTTGIDNAAASKLSTFANAGWDIGATGGTNTIWRIYDGQSGPLLRSFLTPITVTSGAAGKTYNGTTTTAVSSYSTSISGAVLEGSLSYVTLKNAGTYSAAFGTLTGAGLYSGQQGYDIIYTGGSETITQADVTLSTSDVTKTYNGTTSASGTADVAAGQLFGSDSLSGGIFAFTDKNAGSGKTVTASGVTINDGNNGNNYRITYVNNTTSTISKAAVTVSTSDVTKTYDGTTSASGTADVTAGQLFGSDSLSGGAFAFTDKNAGAGNKNVTAAGVTVNDGNNGNNYDVTYADNTTSTINKADLAVTASAADKVYDGTTSATVTYTDNRIAGDSLSFTGTASFADKNAGDGKTVTVGSIDLGGADAGNYNPIVTGGTTADITPASLTVTADAASKFFDGRAFAGGNGVTINGLVNGETMADLLGALAYGGSSQGATGIGNYIIAPGGLNSVNYRISFVDGILSIKALSQASAALGGSALEQAYDSVQKTNADISDGDGQPAQSEDKSSDLPNIAANANSGASTATVAQVTPRLSIAGCGMSMPAGGGC